MTKATGALTFLEWCAKNSNSLWRKNPNGVAVALSDVSLPVFKEITRMMDVCHSNDHSCGEVVKEVLISKNSVHLRSGPTKLASYLDPKARVGDDLRGFASAVKKAVTTTLLPEFQPPAATVFASQLDLLKSFSQSAASLRNYAFLLRNSPLLLDSTGKMLFFRKVLSLSEFDPFQFFKDVSHFNRIGDDWRKEVSYPELIAIRDFDPRLYKNAQGTVKFYRNCLGHIRDNERFQAIWSDERILLALEDDLPRVMPHWYFALMQLKPKKCIYHCSYSFVSFLREHPSIFT